MRARKPSQTHQKPRREINHESIRLFRLGSAGSPQAAQDRSAKDRPAGFWIEGVDKGRKIYILCGLA